MQLYFSALWVNVALIYYPRGTARFSEGPLFRKSVVPKVRSSEGSLLRRFIAPKVRYSEIRVHFSENKVQYSEKRMNLHGK